MSRVATLRFPDSPPSREDFARFPWNVGAVAVDGATLVLSKRGGAFTVEEWERLPADEGRWELVNGRIVVSPTPRLAHQLAVMRLGHLLARHCPEHLLVLSLPLDVRVGDHSVLAPDLLVIPASTAPETHWADPLLVAEVLSPGGERRDREVKRRLYAERGVPSYWIVDVDVPSITVLELRAAGGYVEAATARGEEAVILQRPFAMRMSPAQLLTGEPPET